MSKSDVESLNSRVEHQDSMYMGMIGDGLRTANDMARHKTRVARARVQPDPENARIEREIAKQRQRAARAMTRHHNTMRAQAKVPHGIPRAPPPPSPPPPPTPPDQFQVEWGRTIEQQRFKCCNMMDTLHSMKSPMSNAKNTRFALTQPLGRRAVVDAGKEAKKTVASQATGGRKVCTGWGRTGGLMHRISEKEPTKLDFDISADYAGTERQMAQQRVLCSAMMSTFSDLQKAQPKEEPTKRNLIHYLDKKRPTSKIVKPTTTTRTRPVCVDMSGELCPMMFAY